MERLNTKAVLDELFGPSSAGLFSWLYCRPRSFFSKMYISCLIYSYAFADTTCSPSQHGPSPGDEPSASRGEPSASRDEPSASRDDPSASHNEPSASHDEPSGSRDEPSASRDELSESVG